MKPDTLQQPVGLGDRLVALSPEDMHRHLDHILAQGPVLPEIEGLEHHPETGADALDLSPVSDPAPTAAIGFQRDLFTANKHPAEIRDLEHVDASEER